MAPRLAPAARLGDGQAPLTVAAAPLGFGMGSSRVASARTVSTTTTRALLERGDELRRIEACLDAARAGAGSTLAIEGPAGIGKTALLSAARAAGRAAGMTVLAARGAEIERDFAHGAVRQLLEPALAGAAEAERAELLSGAAALAAPIVVPTAERAGAADAFGVLHGLYWLCANLSAQSPLLLVVDDAHWADAASLRFLEFLARRVEGLPIALVVAARPGAGADGLLADPATELVRPAPLSATAVADLVHAGLGRTPEAGARGGAPPRRGPGRRAVGGRDAARGGARRRRPGRARLGSHLPAPGARRAAGRLPARTRPARARVRRVLRARPP